MTRLPARLLLMPYGAVRFRGRVGAYIDRILQARILSEHAARRILPEAIEAFRNRVDDRIAPGRGLWQGEFWGKWTLSAVAAQQYTGDERLKETILEGVRQVTSTQRADGYIGTYHDSGFVVGNTWNVWCRKYTLWGLLAAYELLHESFILEAAVRMTDHLMTEVGPDAVRIVETGNFAGLPSSSILTPVVTLYRLTGDSRFFEYAHWIVEDWGRSPDQPPDIVRKGLTGRPPHTWFPDAGPWTKAYEFLSCVEGLIDLGTVSGESDYLQVARNIHRAVVQWDRAITGGIGDNDKMNGAARRPDGLHEPCDVVYWERLSTRLFEIDADPAYADEIERLAANILLGASNRDGSWALRRTGLSEPHLIAPLHCLLHHHQCCVANIPRGLLQLARTAVVRTPQADMLIVNAYFPFEAQTSVAGDIPVRIEVDSDYPWEDGISVTVDPAEPAEFALAFRIPGWARRPSLRIDNETISPEDGEAGTYATIRRRWQRGDRVDITLGMEPAFHTLPGNDRFLAVTRGPVVLARCTRIEPGKDIHAPLPLDVESVHLLRREEPEQDGVHIHYRLTAPRAKEVVLCDYASTAGDFRKPENPKAFRQMIDNRTQYDLRVWLPVS